MGPTARMLALAAAIAAGPPAGAQEAGGLRIGVNGHDNWTTPTHSQAPAERVFALLARNGFTSYRVDVGTDARSHATLARLVALGRRHGIVVRPMLYVDDVKADDVARIAAAFAADIPLWELGNELNLRGAERFAEGIGNMMVARRGIEAAARETGRPLRTALNVTAFAGTSGKGLDLTRTRYPFVDAAIRMGLPFDVITYHYYPSAHDRATGWIRTYLDPLRRYGKPVILNETNCAAIYQGDDGNSEACAAAVAGLLDEITLNYADLISEVALYELYDDPHAEAGPEQHFGLMFDIDRPKRTFSVARDAALGRRGGERRDGPQAR